MGSIGEILRQARETQGLSLEQVASLTKIQEPYIKALEEEDFEALPEQIFTKGFVRTYSRSLGIDEDDALRQFSGSSGSYYSNKEKEKQQTQKQVEEDRKDKKNRNVVIAIIGTLLITLIFILPAEQQPPSTLPPQGNESRDFDTQNPQAIIEKEGAESASPPDSIPSVRPVPLSQVPSSNPTSETSGVDQKELVLELEAIETTWIVVQPDAESRYEALLQPGQIARWKANKRFLLTLGNAGGVEISLNGKPLGPLGEPGSVVRDHEIKP